MTIAGWEAGVAALRDSRPIKHLLLDLAFNKNEEVRRKEAWATAATVVN